VVKPRKAGALSAGTPVLREVFGTAGRALVAGHAWAEAAERHLDFCRSL